MRWLALLLLAQPLNLNQQPIVVQDEGVRVPATARATTINCSGAGVTCTQSGAVMTMTIPGGGSGGKVDEAYAADASAWSRVSQLSYAADASALAYLANEATALATDPTACPGGQFVTDLAANGALTCATPSGGGGSANFVTGTVVFDGGSSDALATVTAAWATSGSSLICTADGEESSVEGLQVVATSKSAGSFVVRAKVDQLSHAGALAFVCTGN